MDCRGRALILICGAFRRELHPMLKTVVTDTIILQMLYKRQVHVFRRVDRYRMERLVEGRAEGPALYLDRTVEGYSRVYACFDPEDKAQVDYLQYVSDMCEGARIRFYLLSIREDMDEPLVKWCGERRTESGGNTVI